MRLASDIPLPPDYRLQDFLEFHGRDALGVAEKTTASSLKKGILWEGLPACLTIDFQEGKALVELAVDGEILESDKFELEALVVHMLGLTQSTSQFEEIFESHDQIGRLIKKQHGLRVPQSASLFEALTWAITGQQISLSAAISIRRKLIEHHAITHSSGIACYPNAEKIALMTEADLKLLGFSKSKASALIHISQMVKNSELPLSDWAINRPIEEIVRILFSIKGIGYWTINYTLLRGLGWLDGSLHGDAAVRSKLSLMLGRKDEISEKETSEWLEQFSPWRALVAAHLWAMEKAD